MAERSYPSYYKPGQGNKDLDEAWRILDSIKDGVIPDDVRNFLAGAIVGTRMQAREKQ